MARTCAICGHRDQAAIKQAFSSGLSDRAIARRFGMSHVAVGNHRKEHILKPMTAAVSALDRGTPQRQQREQQLADIAAGDEGTIATTIAAFSQTAQLNKMSQHEASLAGLFNQAVAEGSITAATNVVSQQIRTVEVGSKIAGVGGYAPARTVGEAGEASSFSVNIIFSESGHRETITVANPASPRTFDANENDADWDDGISETSESSSADRVINTTDESYDE
jgi:hypothetical protein